MRQLIMAAVATAALAVPGAAAAGTAPPDTCITPVYPCVDEALAGVGLGPLPDVICQMEGCMYERACRVVWGEPCGVA